QRRVEGLDRPPEHAHLRPPRRDRRRGRLRSATPRPGAPRPRRDLGARPTARRRRRNRDEPGFGDHRPGHAASVATVDHDGRYCLRRDVVSRPVLTAVVLLAVAGFAAAVVLPSSAVAGSTPTTTGATTTSSRSPSSRTRVETVFPAAGELVGNSVAARKSPNPNSRVIKVMHYFRPDYRVQEILAVSEQTGSDG